MQARGEPSLGPLAEYPRDIHRNTDAASDPAHKSYQNRNFDRQYVEVGGQESHSEDRETCGEHQYSLEEAPIHILENA